MNFKKSSSFQKPLTGSEIHGYLKDRLTGTKEKSVLTSAFTASTRLLERKRTCLPSPGALHADCVCCRQAATVEYISVKNNYWI